MQVFLMNVDGEPVVIMRGDPAMMPREDREKLTDVVRKARQNAAMQRLISGDLAEAHQGKWHWVPSADGPHVSIYDEHDNRLFVSTADTEEDRARARLVTEAVNRISDVAKLAQLAVAELTNAAGTLAQAADDPDNADFDYMLALSNRLYQLVTKMKEEVPVL